MYSVLLNPPVSLLKKIKPHLFTDTESPGDPSLMNPWYPGNIPKVMIQSFSILPLD